MYNQYIYAITLNSDEAYDYFLETIASQEYNDARTNRPGQLTRQSEMAAARPTRL